MLEALCGNKNIQKILIFLFVNSKCYGTLLHRTLKTPLTPIQKALDRLEKGGIITSYYEGKTRLYQFDPAYPLLAELEQLLKKAYTLLPALEKKQYYVVKEAKESHPEVLLLFGEKLQRMNKLVFNAKGKGWNGKGQGEVVVSKEGYNTLIFNEKGNWKGNQGDVCFSNVFRWTLDRQAGVIGLEHLRRGLENPVFLVHLAPSGKNALASVDSHLCEEDAYFGQIHFERYGLRLNWRVIGPKKNEEIDYYYS